MIKAETEGLKDVLKWLDDKQKDKVPDAAMKAVNTTANIARKAVYDEMRKVFDRPTPYTMRSVWIDYATKERLSADVYIKDEGGKGVAPVKYLWPEVYGGRRNQKGFERLLSSEGYIQSDEFLMPWKVKKDQYGNVTGGTIQKILSGLRAQKDDYQNSPAQGGDYRGTRKRRRVVRTYYIDEWYKKNKGITIIWEHDAKSGRRTPLFVSQKRATYKRRLRFNEVVQQTVGRVLVTEFLRALGD